MASIEAVGRAGAFGASPLVGRDRELAIIHHHVARLGKGSGGFVLIEGEAGSGKTRLVEATILAARRLGVSAAHAGSEPTAARSPFHLVLSMAAALDVSGERRAMLEQLLSDVGERSGPVALVPPGSARVAVVDAIVGEVEAMARSPLMLAIEDLHWADDASLATLSALLPLTVELPLLVVATARPQADLSRLRAKADNLGSVLMLPPLSPAEVTELAGHLLGTPPSVELDAVAQRVGGNPLLLSELFRDLIDRGLIQVSDTGASLVGSPEEVDGVVVDTLSSRLGSLPPSAMELLRPAAIIGETFTVRDVATLRDRPAATLAEAVEICLEAGILVAESSRLRFRHGLLREAVYDGIASPVRAAMHEEAARLLASRGASPVVVAAHAVLGTAPADAVEWLRTAALDVLSLAPETALSMLDEALALGVDDASVLAAIQRARIESLMGVGRLEEAAVLADQVLPLFSTGDERAELRIRLAGILVLLNRTGEAVAHLEQAQVDADRPDRRALAAAHRALALMTMSEFEAAGLTARQAGALAETSGDRAARTIAASVLGRLPCFTHGYAVGLPAAIAAVESADADPTGRAHDYVPWFWTGLVALDLDEHELVEEAVVKGRQQADDAYAAWAQPLYCGLAASLHFRRGSLADCRAEAASGISLSVDTGSTQAKMWCESLSALAAHLEGDELGAKQLAADAESTWQSTNALLGIDHFALAQTLEMPDEATRVHLGGAWDLFTAMASLNCQPVLAVPLARVARRSDPERFRSVLGAMSDAARRTSLGAFSALELHLRGLGSASIETLEESAEAFELIGRRIDSAEARADAARVAAAQGDGRTWRLVTEAARAFERCGASGAAGRLISALSPDGGVDGRPQNDTGWPTLTRTEREIAALVGQAMSNSEIAAHRFVSRRTVESHLRRIYQKLGYSSRTRLALEARQRRDR